MAKKQDEQNQIDIAVMKNDIDALKEDMKEIKTNHLPHIEAKLVSLELKLAKWGGAIAILILILGAMPWILKLLHII